MNNEDYLKQIIKEAVIEALNESANLDFNYKAYDINSSIGRSYILKDSYTKKYIDYLSENTGEIYVDTDNNKMIGYIFVGKTKDKGFISTLEVAKSYRGLGFGKRLLLDAIKKYDAIDLVVYKDNKIALNLYKKYGFVIIGEAKNNKAWWMKLKSKLTKEDKKRVIKESANNTHPKYVSGYKLTPEGYRYCKKLFSKLLAKDQRDYNTIKTQKQAAGISESGDVGFVKQNANLFRISSSDNESVGTRRKYCFALKIDRGPYLSMADSGTLGFKGNNEYYLYTYTTKKKLKVATAYYIIDHYDMSDELRYKWNLYKDLDLWSNYFRLGNLYRNKDKCSNDNLRELYVYLYRVKLDINKYLYRSLFKKDKNKTLQAYIDKGFDAIIDPEDWVGGFAYPLIILNPEDSLEISKVETIKARSN